MRVVVVGAGVVGLTAAIRLREAGVHADVWAEELTPRTTSDVAAALWYPYRAWPAEAVTRWSATGYAELRRLADVPGSGVGMRLGTELFRERTPDPWWLPAVPDFRRPTALPAGFADGYRFTAPVADMSVHLPFLMRRLGALGGDVVRRTVRDLGEVLRDSDVVVNCAGLGAPRLAGDDGVVPVRGQVVRVAQRGIDEWLIDEHNPAGLAYVVPRERDVVLGGTAQEGRVDLTPDPADAAAIMERCTALHPALAGLRVLGHAVGLRPVRGAVRVDREPDRPVVHDYGHGGAGVTLSWGCAEDVVRLVRA